jgi:hypothetical protein
MPKQTFCLQLAENYDSLFFEASAKSGYNCNKVHTML